MATSGIAGGGEGLFARKQFLPGDIVSYFSGKKKLEDTIEVGPELVAATFPDAGA